MAGCVRNNKQQNKREHELISVVAVGMSVNMNFRHSRFIVLIPKLGIYYFVGFIYYRPEFQSKKLQIALSD